MTNAEHAANLQRYADWRPTQFDHAGIALHDRRDWRVLPVIQTRDSGALEQSNYAAALSLLADADPSGDHYEDHRFGHWACGWLEIIIVDPTHEPTANAAGEIARRLADYPVLDEDDLSARELRDYEDCWRQYAASEFRRTIRETFELSSATDLTLADANPDDLRALYEQTGQGFEPRDDGPLICYASACERLTRQDIAAFLRRIRNRQNRPTATRVHCPACGITYEQTGAVPVVCGACGARLCPTCIERRPENPTPQE